MLLSNSAAMILFYCVLGYKNKDRRRDLARYAKEVRFFSFFYSVLGVVCGCIRGYVWMERYLRFLSVFF